MSPAPPKRPPGRPRRPDSESASVDADGDHAARLRGIVGKGLDVIEKEMDVLTEPLPNDVPASPDTVDRILVLIAKASEIRGQIVRADANVTRRKPTLATVEKDIASLSPDERAHLIERFKGEGKSVLS